MNPKTRKPAVIPPETKRVDSADKTPSNNDFIIIALTEYFNNHKDDIFLPMIEQVVKNELPNLVKVEFDKQVIPTIRKVVNKRVDEKIEELDIAKQQITKILIESISNALNSLNETNDDSNDIT